jgi:ornithine decarboxylase antizyme 1
LVDYNRKTSFDSASSSDLSFIDEDDDDDDDHEATNVATNNIVKSNERASGERKMTAHNDDDSSSDESDNDVINKIVSQKAPIRLTIKLNVTEKISTSWDSVLDHEHNILYVALPAQLTHEASKQSFLSLLEFAEEKLDCDGVVLCIRKDRPDRANLVKTFLFLGFQPLHPHSPLAPPAEYGNNDENLFLIYHIED